MDVQGGATNCFVCTNYVSPKSQVQANSNQPDCATKNPASLAKFTTSCNSLPALAKVANENLMCITHFTMSKDNLTIVKANRTCADVDVWNYVSYSDPDTTKRPSECFNDITLNWDPACVCWKDKCNDDIMVITDGQNGWESTNRPGKIANLLFGTNKLSSNTSSIVNSAAPTGGNDPAAL